MFQLPLHSDHHLHGAKPYQVMDIVSSVLHPMAICYMAHFVLLLLSVNLFLLVLL